MDRSPPKESPPLRLPKLLAFDLDGTLLPNSKRVTPLTREVLEELRLAGCHVTLATGKFHHLARQYGEELELDLPQISLDGATVGGNGFDIVRRGIDVETARQLLDSYGAEADHAFADDGRDTMLLRSSDSKEFRWATRFWADEVRHVEDLRDHLREPTAVVTLYGRDAAMQRVKREVLDTVPSVRIAEFWSELLEVRRVTFQPAGVDKGTGVVEVARRLGIGPEDCMVFGDWLNDLPMFGIGATNVAMSNAVAEVLDAADHVTAHSCEDDGVARFLRDAFL
ncbi:MAG: HAD family hydrolase [Acidobacteriota bacterium]